MQIGNYKHLLLKTALIKNSPHYLYIIKFSECQEYLRNNAQEILDNIMNENEEFNIKNRVEVHKVQLKIVKYLYENFNISTDKIPYRSNNSKLINYVKNKIK